MLEFLVLVGLGRSERGAEEPPGARLPCCRCCTKRLQVSWNRDPRPASQRRWADGWARSCCPSRNRHGARLRNSSWAGGLLAGGGHVTQAFLALTPRLGWQAYHWMLERGRF